jgi:CspA family cold shock protein
MMQGTMQTIYVERGFGFIRDTDGGDVFFHHSALIPPENFATLEVEIGVEFEPELGPKGPRTAKISVTPLDTHPALSFSELAAYFQRRAAG